MCVDAVALYEEALATAQSKGKADGNPSYCYATRRIALGDAVFDWPTGRVICRSDDGSRHEVTEWDDPALDEPEGYGTDWQTFSGGMIAIDAYAIYIFDHYDSNTELHRILLDVSRYLDDSIGIPYPGGG